MLEWKEISPETWQAEHNGRRAHVFLSDGRWCWYIDGGDVHQVVDGAEDIIAERELAKHAASIAFGLHADRAPTAMEASAAMTMAQGESDRGDIDEADTGASDFTMSQLGRRRARLVRRLEHLRQRSPRSAVQAGYDAAEASALETAIALFDERLQARSLAERVAARLSPKLPAETRAQLQASAEQVGSFTDAIRDFAEEGGDPGLVEAMLGEAASRAEALVDAALEVRRELQARRALAEARKKLLTEQADAARSEERAADAAIDRLDELVIKPICRACGTGDTKAIRAMTGRVSIVKNAAAVELDEGALDYLDDESGLVRITREPNKTAIAAALAEGREVPGARLVQRTRVEVRG